jgi:hypothetical protein
MIKLSARSYLNARFCEINGRFLVQTVDVELEEILLCLTKRLRINRVRRILHCCAFLDEIVHSYDSAIAESVKLLFN